MSFLQQTNYLVCSHKCWISFFLIVAIAIVAMFQLFSFVLLKYLYKSAADCSTSQVFMRTALHVFYSRQLINLLYIYIYIYCFFSVFNISILQDGVFWPFQLPSSLVFDCQCDSVRRTRNVTVVNIKGEHNLVIKNCSKLKPN